MTDREPLKLTILEELPENLDAVPKGTLYLVEEGYFYWCPGCGKRSFLNTENPQERPYWRTEREGDNLSLSPSLHHATKLGGCGWHGFLRNGMFRRV